MFEVGFSEILLVLVIALVVIGPERLPEVARGLGKMVAKIKGFIDNVRNETSLQEELADLRRQLDLSKEAAQLQNLGETLRSDIESSVNEVDYSLYNRPSSDEIRRQHREAEVANSAINNPEHDEEALALANIQRPTFGREHYEALPEDYHQQSDGALTPKTPDVPQLPEPTVHDHTTGTPNSAKTA